MRGGQGPVLVSAAPRHRGHPLRMRLKTPRCGGCYIAIGTSIP
jgi:hypothetical protein